VLGSDKRASLVGSKGLSDTTILLRLDPDNDAIAIMNIPRDLKTYIPGVGTTKFNEAYAYGGPKLTLEVVKRVTGLPINHVVNVDFLGFIRAINAIECVYIDVDRRYYHSNAGLPAHLQYAEINIQPGYQKLCGEDALQYVRYRHTDTDLVRAARQQDFLREARQRVPISKLVLPSDREELINIFTTYTSSDIESLRSMLDVLDLLIASRNAPIREVRFPAILHPSFVTASSADIQGAVDKFSGIEASGGPRGALEAPGSAQTGIVPEERKRAKGGKDGGQPPEEKLSATPTRSNDGLVDAAQGSRDVAATAARRVGKSFPIFYPRRLPSGSIYVQNPRVYHVRDSDKNPRGAYRTVLQLPQGDYFGVQGIRGWTNPPILSDPSETRTIRGREFKIYLDGDRVRLIAWEDKGNSYWISNSLLQTLTNDQMLGMARSIHKIPGERGRKRKRR
jgi:polyisoprenyl-teichoic acid--peptidoglycan teichoic acid transferase